jgi:hypothetical protein
MPNVLHFRDQLAKAICAEVGVPIKNDYLHNQAEGLCIPVIDMNEFLPLFRKLASQAPEIIEDIITFLRCEGATYETGRRIVDYLFVVADSPASDADHLLALRFRNAQERLAARAAFDVHTEVADGHGFRS